MKNQAQRGADESEDLQQEAWAIVRRTVISEHLLSLHEHTRPAAPSSVSAAAPHTGSTAPPE